MCMCMCMCMCMFMCSVCGRCVCCATCCLRSHIRTAVNLPLPSSTLLGAQHMRMLDPMHARMPQRAPMMPGMPAAKPIIEKMELAHRQCAVRSVSRETCRCMCMCRDDVWT